MTIERKVVVVEKANVLRHVERDLFAARFTSLGLTAYGRDEEDAIFQLKRLFNRFITEHRKLGSLERRLNELGVEWYWADKYPGHLPEYEETGGGANDTWRTVSATGNADLRLLMAA